ncbi:MAG: hypothetical protein JWN36_1046 [Microbacteriaceae bacterium]|nr:hypothetical protein [Microbacteriaceae bacterium]
MAGNRIVVVGDVIDDVVVVPEHTIRPDTDTTSSIRSRPGGSAANAAAWIADLGGHVDFVGAVGAADVERHRALLPGVRAHLIGHPTLPTGTIVVIVDGDTRTMLTETGANAALTADEVPDDLLDAAAATHFTGYSLFGSPHRAEAVRRLFHRARDRGVGVSVDPGSAGFIADFGPERFLDAIDGARFLFPNLDEGRLLTGLDDAEEVVAALAKRFEIVALTLDTEGVLVARHGADTQRVNARPVEVIDPTGAGDAFAAGFLTEWVRSGDAITAAETGVAAGARAVQVIGGRPA